MLALTISLNIIMKQPVRLYIQVCPTEEMPVPWSVAFSTVDHNWTSLVSVSTESCIAGFRPMTFRPMTFTHHRIHMRWCVGPYVLSCHSTKQCRFFRDYYWFLLCSSVAMLTRDIGSISVRPSVCHTQVLSRNGLGLSSYFLSILSSTFWFFQ